MDENNRITADDTEDLNIAEYIDDVEDYHEEKKIHTRPRPERKK